MVEVIACAQCGSEVLEQAPHGLCPQCLLKVALDDTHTESGYLSQSTPVAGGNSKVRRVDLPADRVLGDYELLAEIARGGMGVVYKARQTSLNRTVAVKMILAGQLALEQDVTRFRTEAEAAANLQHPNIVAIHEVGEHDGRPFFSMDYVEGRSLAELIRDDPPSVGQSAEYVMTVARAIHYAHQQGILHRDLKPSNILIDETGRPRVTDFGLAKQVEGDSGLTATGVVLGTPSYMLPEQATAQRGEVGPASDVYSLGAVLYELLSGKPPFQAETPVDTVMQVLDQEPPPPKQFNSRIPTDLETICLKCLQKDPKQRYASAQDLADELERFLNGELIEARPITLAARFGRWCKRHPAQATLAISSLALIGALLSLFNGWQERSFLQHGKVELNVQRKNDRLTATVGEVILIFDWPTDVHHRSRSHMSLPVRGGSRTTIKMTRRTVHGRGETGPAGVNIIKISDYEFYLADHCQELCLPSPIGGVRRFFLKSYKKPMTIVIAKDGTHRVKR